ncbi:hypothetical protein BH20ACT23_BH20ACT23_19380 [soil metagenome]
MSKDGQLRDDFRMIQRQTVGDAAASVVAGNKEALETQSGHQPDLIQGHRPLRIWLVIGSGVRFRAVAVAAEVGRDDGEMVGQSGSEPVPHDVCLWMPMEEE